MSFSKPKTWTPETFIPLRSSGPRRHG